ncbi:hypothetical protein PG993_013489 [Apiospora rasikravindrae]|uniref:Uncharacterized protein n=1 Tax=Apiospora rasikravindrae TaxID=990691 RepID=A0ABR1RXR9_9PEZI
MASAQSTPPEAPADPNTIPGPTVLFWIVCLALNAMAEPSGSICGPGYEPHWLLRMSPIMALSDGLHLAATFVLSFHQRGRSYRLATAGALLPRLGAGSNGVFGVVEARKALAAIDGLLLNAAKAGYVTPMRTRDQLPRLTPCWIAGSRLTISAKPGTPWRRWCHAPSPFRTRWETTDTELLLGQLIVSGDSAQQKERIRRAMLPFRSSVYATKSCLEDLVRSHDVGKARIALQALTATTGFRWFAFGLGVLPQVIKLFGSSGIPAIQAYGAMYLFLGLRSKPWSSGPRCADWISRTTCGFPRNSRSMPRSETRTAGSRPRAIEPPLSCP